MSIRKSFRLGCENFTFLTSHCTIVDWLNPPREQSKCACDCTGVIERPNRRRDQTPNRAQSPPSLPILPLHSFSGSGSRSWAVCATSVGDMTGKLATSDKALPFVSTTNATLIRSRNPVCHCRQLFRDIQTQCIQQRLRRLRMC